MAEIRQADKGLLSTVATDGAGRLDPRNISESAMFRFLDLVSKYNSAQGITAPTNMTQLHEWSIAHRNAFWSLVYTFLEIKGEGDPSIAFRARVDPPTPLAVDWFPDVRLNFAENLLRFAYGPHGDTPAIVSWSESLARSTLSFNEVADASSAVAAHYGAFGLEVGDRVFGYLPNIPEAVICMLGAATVGATWSSCGTDYQLEGLIGRLERVKPKVLVAARSYIWRGHECDLLPIVREAIARTPSIEHVVIVDYLADSFVANRTGTGSIGESTPCTEYREILKKGFTQVGWTRFPFNHPLYVMFSSGTTGKPKGIVHSAGGTLLEHEKELAIHSDVRAGDIFFYQTSTSWMMWNWAVSSLSRGATLVLYDGDPLVEEGKILFRLVDQERVTHFGTSASFLSAVEKRNIKPGSNFAFDSLRTILSTGSTLYPEQFDYIAKDIGSFWVQSISGGTDIVGCFGLGTPLKPVVRGEVQCKSLGYDVRVFSEDGSAIVGKEGELVCVAPAPSMPICFLDDPEGSAYRAAYFDVFPGIWRHGDYVLETESGGLVFMGRSDATLKPGGVRVATADIYAAIHQIARVQLSIAVGYTPPGQTSEKIVLFITLAPGDLLDDTLVEKIKTALRAVNVYYVPALIVQAPEIPRTTNNKLAEVSVKRLIKGLDVSNGSSLANPASLDFFRCKGREAVIAALG